VLDILCKRDSEWRKLALQICGCPHKANDLVQDMYIKLMNKKEPVNTSFVYHTMKHIFIDSIRKVNPEVSTDDFKRISNIDDNDKTQERFELLDMIKECSWFEREVLLLTHEKSLRKASEDTGVFYGVLNYHKQKALSKLKEKYGRTKR
jgi:RNA polymerase sigma factor (sigma-70 family)